MTLLFLLGAGSIGKQIVSTLLLSLVLNAAEAAGAHDAVRALVGGITDKDIPAATVPAKAAAPEAGDKVAKVDAIEEKVSNNEKGEI